MTAVNPCIWRGNLLGHTLSPVRGPFGPHAGPPSSAGYPRPQRQCFHFTFSLEQLQVAIAFSIGEIDLIDTVLVTLFEDGGVVGLGHDHGYFVFIGDSDGGLGDMAAKGAEQEMDFIDRRQALVELR